MEGQTIGPIIRNFIKKLNELEDEPLNSQSIDCFSCRLREMEEELVSIVFHLHRIETYNKAKVDYDKSIQELNEKWFME